MDVNPATKRFCKTNPNGPGGTSIFFFLKGSAWLGFCLLLCGLPAWAQAQGGDAAAETPQVSALNALPSTAGQDSHVLNEGPQVPGAISGTVVDQSGAIVAGAQVTLVREN